MSVAGSVEDREFAVAFFVETDWSSAARVFLRLRATFYVDTFPGSALSMSRSKKALMPTTNHRMARHR